MRKNTKKKDLRKRRELPSLCIACTHSYMTFSTRALAKGSRNRWNCGLHSTERGCVRKKCWQKSIISQQQQQCCRARTNLIISRPGNLDCSGTASMTSTSILMGMEKQRPADYGGRGIGGLSHENWRKVPCLVHCQLFVCCLITNRSHTDSALRCHYWRNVN